MSALNEDQTELPGDELVAYLDGELPPQEARRIEERLTADEDYRRQLHDLDQAWEALDALPKTTADDHFARTTIEMVSVVAEQEVTTQKSQATAASRKRFVTWFAVGLAGVAAGFMAASLLLPNSDEALLADLPVIYQSDILSEVEDVEMLRRLPAIAPVDQWANDNAATERELAAIQASADPSSQERRRWVENLTPDEKAVLASKQKRFQEIAKNPKEQQRLRDLEQAIRHAEDANQLQMTLVAYNGWLTQLRPGDREDLSTLPTDERLDLIRRIVHQDAERASRRLSAEDSSRLREEIMKIYDERKSAFERSMRRRDHDNRVKLEGPQTRRALIVLNWELRNDDRDDETRDRLVKQLSPEAQSHWEKISRHDRRRRALQLWQWLMQSMRPSLDPKTLEEFFANDLESSEQERLLSLPPDEMQSQLERLYLAERFGLRDADQWLGEPGGFSPGPAPDGRRSTGDRPRERERRGGRPRSDDEKTEK